MATKHSYINSSSINSDKLITIEGLSIFTMVALMPLITIEILYFVLILAT